MADPHTWLIKEWASRLALSLESMTGSAPKVTAAESAGAPALSEAPLWWRQPFEPLRDAAIWVGAEQSVWSDIGNAVLTAAGVEETTPEDLRGTYLEVIRQALSGMAQALAGLTRQDVRCAEGGEAAEGPADRCVPFHVQFSGAKKVTLAIAFSTGLLELGQSSQKPAQTVRAPESVPAEAEEPDTKHTIDLLYEVELPVSVSFGRARLPLKEVLKLTSGSIVELNRTVSEPVEIIVNNCVIARGEVVVVDGNYGVRVMQILSRRERLRTLY
jgi:flagellar motor switch protein FliN/FliY